MLSVTDDEFAALIARAMDELPAEYIRNLDNVAITYADEPSAEQRQKMKLDGHHLLLGLYEGIPLTQRGAGYTMVLPDKITLFKNQILQLVTTPAELFEQVKRTVWHEIAHFYGLDHARMRHLEQTDRHTSR